MGLYRTLGGTLCLEVVSADLPRFFAAANAAGIELRELMAVDGVTVRFRIPRGSMKRITALADRRGEKIRIIGRRGLFWKFASLKKRPVLIVGLAILTALAIFLPSRVLMVEVEGNTTIPDNQIIEAAARCGIGFGASRRAIRSERVKNALLEAMPELSWAGVNTYGSRAVISVRQRQQPEVEETGPAVSSIAAERDGVVLSCRTEQGTAQCIPGQAVRAGDILISGYTDCGLCMTATRAVGEVMAATSREMTVITPANCLKRTGTDQEKVTYSLIVGKNRFNFHKSSGISPAGCGRMVAEYILTLPGGLPLPLKLVRETVTTCSQEPTEVDEDAARTLLSGFAEDYLKQQMIAGTVAKALETVTADDGLWILTGNYACTEMIGRERAEQNGE